MERPSLISSVRQTAMRSPSPRPVIAAIDAPAAVFDDAGVDVAVLDHHGVVEHAHVGHAAIRMPRVEVAAEQRILLRGRPVGDDLADEVAVGLHDPAHIAGGAELVHENAHRHAGIAEIAGRPIGDRLRASESPLRQDLVQLAAAPPDDVREDLPLLLARQIRTGGGRSEIELRCVARLTRHAFAFVESPWALVLRPRIPLVPVTSSKS